ncbi:hypothetical protein MSAR_21860 [Mycolicibacterium sarraceniae]|uniref:Uncharacterized protein n=1 Tax=Mycolicibacterium sarraceniae TaxID=1534348 RepID=A0A7I7SR29_9MYCO|nr:hypothetical protein MSAR_21860 [Mycolicibacterium sarraceniae]
MTTKCGLVWVWLPRTCASDAGRRFSTDDLGMAAKPHYPADYLQQLAEPFRAGGACQFGKAR